MYSVSGTVFVENLRSNNSKTTWFCKMVSLCHAYNLPVVARMLIGVMSVITNVAVYNGTKAQTTINQQPS